MDIVFLHDTLSITDKRYSKEYLGGKGFGLVKLAALGLPIPNGFILPAPLWKERHGQEWRRIVENAWDNLQSTLLEQGRLPVVSVRSGAAVSMPGMMDTVLNVGLKYQPTLALEAHFSSDVIEKLFKQWASPIDTFAIKDPISPLQEVSREFSLEIGEPACSTLEDLLGAVEQVWDSWDSQRAKTYRAYHGVDASLGTAVVVQAMVFGNGKGSSCTGVMFTKGASYIGGEYLIQAQGEDLVSGKATPLPLETMREWLPETYHRLLSTGQTLEALEGCPQEIEFTVERGQLWFLQSRNLALPAQTILETHYQKVKKGWISPKDMVETLDPHLLESAVFPSLPRDHGLSILAKGTPVSGGAVCGVLRFSPSNTVLQDPFILVTKETTCQDLATMIQARGVVTLTGGATSHAAVVLRSMGKPCVVSLAPAFFQEDQVCIAGHWFKEGDKVTLDAKSGALYAGYPTFPLTSTVPEYLEELLGWIQPGNLQVLANAETSEDLCTALRWGATGIGLCRTEHMMLRPAFLFLLQQYILETCPDQGNKILARLQEEHMADFLDLFTQLGGKPFTVRLLDPPLHEFLPVEREAQKRLAHSLNVGLETVCERLQGLEEINPMLGYRGCRLAFGRRELYDMQLKAIFQSALAYQEAGGRVDLRLLIPFVSHPEELFHIKRLITVHNPGIPYKLGIMMEIPRALLLADVFAPHVDFISFGTNDLTQMVWGLSRDDVGAFWHPYEEAGILDPFRQFDEEGVGLLMKAAVEKARRVSPDLQFSVCGEHASCPRAMAFFQMMGIQSISCSPWKLPVARLLSMRLGHLSYNKGNPLDSHLSTVHRRTA